MHIRLVVTGDMEEIALPRLLARLCATGTFTSKKAHGFTSQTLTASPFANPVPGVTPVVQKLARDLVASVYPGDRGVGRRRREHYDFAVLVEDLEVANVDLAANVVTFMLEGVARHIDETWKHEAERERVRAEVRNRCSFHLMAPMPEAYFFGDLDALRRAGVTSLPQLDCAQLEAFSSNDASYRAAAPGQHQHPKKYLKHLTDHAYQETAGGAAALENLDLDRVCACLGDKSFLCSFLYDLSTLTETDHLADKVVGRVHELTWAVRSTMLRNV